MIMHKINKYMKQCSQLTDHDYTSMSLKKTLFKHIENKNYPYIT